MRVNATEISQTLSRNCISNRLVELLQNQNWLVGWFIVSQTKKMLRDWDVNTVAAV